MFSLNPINSARTLLTASDSVGARLPAPVLTSFAQANDVTVRASALYPPAGVLAGAVTDCLIAGKDPAADPAVLRALAGMQLGDTGLSKNVELAVAARMVDVFSQHLDGILAAWAKPFDRAAVDLALAHERIGDLPLDDGRAILALGADIAEVWANALAAVRVVDTLAGAWVNLASLTNFAPVDPRYTLLRISPAGPEHLDQSRKHVVVWDVVRAGLPLALADGPEYRRRVAHVEAPVLDDSEPHESWDAEPINAA